jgi:anthranilate 1,2-dioxygenase large subunit
MLKQRRGQAYGGGRGGCGGAPDSEVLDFVQRSLRTSLPAAGVVQLGGQEMGTTDHLISEAAIRSMYEHYRKVMGL